MKFLHTRFRVSNMENSVAFYTQTLGLIVSRRTMSPRGFPLVFLRDKHSDVELELVQLPGTFTIPDDLMHIAFSVTDIHQFTSLMVDEPVKTSSGNLIGFISDPDGYEIELIQK